MEMGTITILGLIGGLIATILAFIFIIPESRLSQLGHPILIFLHNLFNFKSLWIEKILKFFYTFLTITSVATGFFMLFQVEERWGYYYHEKEWVGYRGLIVMIVAPIVIRIVYELLMMTVLLVKNTIEINNKLGKQPATSAPSEDAPKKDNFVKREAAPKKEEAPKARYCTKCGHQVDPNSSAMFCTNCGSTLDM